MVSTGVMCMATLHKGDNDAIIIIIIIIIRLLLTELYKTLALKYILSVQ